MRHKSGPHGTAEKHIKDIRRATRKQYSSEEKIRIVLEGLRGEYSIAELDTSKNLDTDPKKRVRVRTFQNRMADKPEPNGLV